jgi:hypothetical protein
MEKKRTRVHTGKPPKNDESRAEQTRAAGNSTLPGVLKPPRIEVPAAETIEEIPIAGIKPFHLIPDYKQPSASEIPTVVNCPAGVLCIDGGEAISKASSEGRSNVLCRIFHIQEDNEIEIAIRKAAIRSKPSGGTCTYPEAIRNACTLFYLLLKSTSNPVVLSHGGARRGAAFISNSEDNIRSMLADRLGKSSTTINKYLSHGEYLSAATMNALVEADVPKGFFEVMQQGKTALVAELKTAQRPPAEIVEVVSARMLVWLKEASTPIPITITPSKDPQAVQATTKNASSSIRTAKAPEFLHWDGNEAGSPSEPPIDEEYLRNEIKRIGTELVRLSEGPDLAETVQIQAIRNLTVQLSKLTSFLVHLSNRDAAAKEGRSDG